MSTCGRTRCSRIVDASVARLIQVPFEGPVVAAVASAAGQIPQIVTGPHTRVSFTVVHTALGIIIAAHKFGNDGEVDFGL